MKTYVYNNTKTETPTWEQRLAPLVAMATQDAAGDDIAQELIHEAWSDLREMAQLADQYQSLCG